MGRGCSEESRSGKGNGGLLTVQERENRVCERGRGRQAGTEEGLRSAQKDGVPGGVSKAEQEEWLCAAEGLLALACGSRRTRLQARANA
eukprot:3978287-Pleurochrysis_carterae.AAC.1